MLAQLGVRVRGPRCLPGPNSRPTLVFSYSKGPAWIYGKSATCTHVIEIFTGNVHQGELSCWSWWPGCRCAGPDRRPPTRCIICAGPSEAQQHKQGLHRLSLSYIFGFFLNLLGFLKLKACSNFLSFQYCFLGNFYSDSFCVVCPHFVFH